MKKDYQAKTQILCNDVGLATKILKKIKNNGWIQHTTMYKGYNHIDEKVLTVCVYNPDLKAEIQLLTDSQLKWQEKSK